MYKLKAFTLIELLIVISIVTILTAIWIPMLKYSEYKIIQDLDRLTNSILFIQHMAVLQGENAYIQLNTTTNTYTGAIRNSGHDLTILPTSQISTNTTISSTYPTIEFSGLYGLPINTYVISFTSNDTTKTINISQTGDIWVS